MASTPSDELTRILTTFAANIQGVRGALRARMVGTAAETLRELGRLSEAQAVAATEARREVWRCPGDPVKCQWERNWEEFLVLQRELQMLKQELSELGTYFEPTHPAPERGA